MKNLSILRTTEKAVMVKINNIEVWLPKSHIKVNAIGMEVIQVSDFLKTQYPALHEMETLERHSVEADELTVVKLVNEDKAEVTFKGRKTFTRKLYPRKTGKLSGSFLLNFRRNIFKFTKVDSNGVAQDLTWIGTYDEGISFEEAIKKHEAAEEVLEEVITAKENIDWSQPVKHKEFETIKTCINNDIPVYLVGPAGSGKNHTLQDIADELNLDFYFTNSIQQEFKITGFIDAGGHYHETEFYKAFKHGGLFFLDEMDASIPEVLVLLNAAIANKYFEFPIGKITAHKDFRVVAAGNTVGNGADEQYTGRLVLDQATLDRFVVIDFDYDRNIEMALAKGNEELVNFINELRNKCQSTGVRGTFSYRCISSIAKLEGTLPLEKIITIAVFKGMDKDTVTTIIDRYSSNKYWKAAQKLIA